MLGQSCAETHSSLAQKVAEASEPSADVEMSEAAAPAQSEEPAEPEPVQVIRMRPTPAVCLIVFMCDVEQNTRTRASQRD